MAKEWISAASVAEELETVDAGDGVAGEDEPEELVEDEEPEFVEEAEVEEEE